MKNKDTYGKEVEESYTIHNGQVVYAEDDLIQRFDELAESEVRNE